MEWGGNRIDARSRTKSTREGREGGIGQRSRASPKVHALGAERRFRCGQNSGGAMIDLDHVRLKIKGFVVDG